MAALAVYLPATSVTSSLYNVTAGTSNTWSGKTYNNYSLEWFNPPGTVPPLEQWVPSVFNYTRATTIYGGSNEIQKNIIAKGALGL